MTKKGKGFSDLTKKVLADKPENLPTSLADFQDSPLVPAEIKESVEERQDVETLKRHDAVTSEPQSVKTSKRHDAKTSKHHDVKTSSLDLALENRLTIYLSEESLDALEAGWLKIRRMTKNKISKSLLIDRAILQAMQELDRKGEKSDLAKSIKG